MAEAFVQGFLATITVNSVDQTLIIESGGLSRSKTILSKGSMDGTGFMKSIPGPTTGTVSITGHIVQLALNDLETAWAVGDVVPFTMEISEGMATDTVYSGSLTLSGFNIDTAADGNWSFSLDGETSGAIVHTPAAAV